MKKLIANLITFLIPSKSLRGKLRKYIIAENKAYINGMSFNVKRHHFWHSFNRKRWELNTIKFYEKYTSPMKNIIDLGGWIGPTMLIAYSYNPKKISMVEADPANYQILKTNYMQNYLNDKVELHNICIYNKSDEIVNFGCKLGKFSSTKGIGDSGIKIRTTSIMEFLTKQDLNETNIIKIDIEGAEQYIEEGIDYISKFPDINILLSIHTPFWKDKEETTKMLLEQFKKFDVFSEDDEKMTLEETREAMNKGGFFTLIVKTKS